MIDTTSPLWRPGYAYPSMTFATVRAAAAALLGAYPQAQPIKWWELVLLRRQVPSGQPGPFTGELLVICAPRAYIVHQVLGGWPGAHVMSIRWSCLAEPSEVRHAA